MTFHKNHYVIEIKTGHPGFQEYTIISTPEHMKGLVEGLSRGLNEVPSNGQIWSDYATIAGGATSRVYLRFAVAADLAPYHKRPPARERVWEVAGCLVVLACLYFTYVGFVNTMEGILK